MPDRPWPGRLVVEFMEYQVYILKSTVDKNLYIGLSANVQKRLKAHNAGNVRSTKHRRPFKLLYTETLKSRVEARTREKYLKSLKGAREKLDIIVSLR